MVDSFPLGMLPLHGSNEFKLQLCVQPRMNPGRIFPVHGIFNMVDVDTRERIQPHVIGLENWSFASRSSSLIRDCKRLSPHWILSKRISYFLSFFQIDIYVRFKNQVNSRWCHIFTWSLEPSNEPIIIITAVSNTKAAVNPRLGTCITKVRQ